MTKGSLAAPAREPSNRRLPVARLTPQGQTPLAPAPRGIAPASPQNEPGPGDRGGDPARLACAHCTALVMAAFGHSRCELVAATRRSADVAFARQVAMYLAHVGAGLSMSEVGRGFGRDRTTVAHACRHVEDRRDDPRIEAMLVCLEAAMVTWRGYALPPRANRPGSRR